MWKITADHLASVGERSKVGFGRTGTKVYTLFDKFRLYDDDGEMYYEGVSAGLETGFEPLNWAMAYAGCTEIRFLNFETGEWEIL